MRYWGLEDFMTVKQTPIYNSANLAMFMVNLSHAVMRPLLPHWPGLSVKGIRLRRDSWNMTAVTQKCTACPSLAAAALEA